MNTEYSEAIVEVLHILQHTDRILIEKIPKKLIEFWERNASKTYEVSLDYHQKLEEMPLKSKTKSLIGMIYRNYWCDTEERKKYDDILKENERLFQEESRKKYNPDDIFKKDISSVQSTLQESKIELVPYKETLLQKIIQKIKQFLKRE